MKKTFQNFLGIDVSKLTFDVALIVSASSLNNIVSSSFSNNKKGVSQLLKFLKKQGIKNLNDELLICMEHTGMYSRILVNNLSNFTTNIWVENAYSIKHSTGIKRGKTDAADSIDIAKYAFRFMDNAKQYDEKTNTVQSLQDVLSNRTRLMNALTNLQKPIKEMESIGLNEAANLLAKHCKAAIDGLKKSLKLIEKDIAEIVKKDEEAIQKINLLQTVPGVGLVTALSFYCTTNGFTKFINKKQLACYCGIAPFPYQSGTSIKGRNQVHFMGNKTLKSMLFLCSMRVIQLKGEMQDYYKRKVEEGKSKMSVLNAISNKIVARMCVVIKNNEPYKNYLLLS
jgi:transposase